MNIKLTNEQWWSISDYSSKPIPLRDADLCVPFLYVRGYGVFYVGMGHHQILSSYVFSWMNDCEDAIETADKLNLGGFDIHAKVADLLTKTGGVAWKSSVGKDVIYSNDLNFAEKSYIKSSIQV